MGRVEGTGFSKMFEGVANDPNSNAIPDTNSIQSAIRKTLDNESLADPKNMDTLNTLAKLYMFTPKRTTLPIDTFTYRNYPTPDITFNFGGYLDEEETRIFVNGELNNKVGWDIVCTVEIYMGNVLNENLNSFTFTVPAGTTTFTNRYNIEGTSNTTEPITVNFIGLPVIYISNNLEVGTYQVNYQLQNNNNSNNNGRLYGNFTQFETTTISGSVDGSVSVISDTEKFLLQSTVSSQTLTVDLNGGTYTAEYYIRTKQTNNAWIYQSAYTTPITANFGLYDYKFVIDSV